MCKFAGVPPFTLGKPCAPALEQWNSTFLVVFRAFFESTIQLKSFFHDKFL